MDRACAGEAELVDEGSAISAGRDAGVATATLGCRLEYDRLEHRALRVRQVLAALRERADARTDVAPPRPLRAAIEDFGRELAELERRLRDAGVR